MRRLIPIAFSSLALTACLSEAPQGIAPSKPAHTTVRMDFEHRPLPEIPLPNDIATRYDETSATGRRVNASMIAPTALESDIRARIDQLDGWGLVQPISVPFTGPIDVQSILDRHRDADYDPSDDAVYLIDITRSSPDFGKLQMLDLGNGNYPALTEDADDYWPNDPRGNLLSLLFEETDEDLNGNGMLDPGEDTDADGVLDKPNYLPGMHPAMDDITARADALMTFYERETNTLIAQPVVPLRERTTYAFVITRRLLDADGQPVGSPYPFVHHAAQTAALEPLPEVLPPGVTLDDLAFVFTFTTQTTMSEFSAVRDGLYGLGVQKALGEDYPAVVDTLEVAKDTERLQSTHIFTLTGEEFEEGLRLLNSTFRGASDGSVAFEQLMEANRYVDYYLMGSFDAPQLFFREDPETGEPLRKNDQSWPQDLDRVPAPTRSERIYFTLVVPRKEVSARGEGKPAPVTILGHGHTGNRFDAINVGPYFARHGLATLAIDNPGHGLDITPEQEALAHGLLDRFGIGPFINACFKDRAIDQNFDGMSDSGADYWDFYLFHTRDNVRQTAVDYMQLIRVLRGFDGTRRWKFDVDGDGTDDLAGDFDGDGQIDVGGDGPIVMSGGSLGGIMSMLMGSIEPELLAIAPIVGGGGLGGVARRSINSSSPRDRPLPAGFGPMILGTADEEGTTALTMLVPNINQRGVEIPIGPVEGVMPGDTMEVANLANGERECGRVNPAGGVRAPIATDIGDPLEVRFYRGDVQIGPDCALAEGSAAYATVDSFTDDVTFQNLSHAAGEPLVSMAEGLGLRRATPDFRRFVGLAQLVMDRADPANYARFLQREPFTYPGTGQTTGAHALMTTGTGDLNVPVDAGMLFARAAGLLDYLHANPDYGVPDNQVLIDHHVLEGVDALKRYTNPEGQGVLIDVNDFSGDTDYWAGRTARLDPPLRSGFGAHDVLGGFSASIFAYGSDRGKHGFDGPGEMIDDGRKRCREQCPADSDCGCDTLTIFDVGNFHYNLAADFLASLGTRLDPNACHARGDCANIAPPPAPRTSP
ncbi:MAG: hypothetical protein KC620_06910 [Myxococcales bacterium]|nr:hypothetical protein [Myxococcales bacterium]